jgi:hypothetical protein
MAKRAEANQHTARFIEELPWRKKCFDGIIAPDPIAVPQLLYPETIALKWHFSQENATLHDARKDM